MIVEKVAAKIKQDYVKKLVFAAAGHSMSRIYNHILQGPFAIVSAVRPEFSPEDNKARTTELRKMFSSEDAGGFVPTLGLWQGASEDSVLLPGASKQTAVAVANKFDQDSVIWGEKGQYYFLDKQGNSSQARNVADQFHIPAQEEKPDAFTELPSGKKFTFREAQSKMVWSYGGIKVDAQKPVSGYSLKSKKKAFVFDSGVDLEADGIPFLYVSDAATQEPKFGCAVRRTGSTPNFHVVLEKGTWAINPAHLALYLPLERREASVDETPVQ